MIKLEWRACGCTHWHTQAHTVVGVVLCERGHMRIIACAHKRVCGVFKCQLEEKCDLQNKDSSQKLEPALEEQ